MTHLYSILLFVIPIARATIIEDGIYANVQDWRKDGSLGAVICNNETEICQMINTGPLSPDIDKVSCGMYPCGYCYITC